MGDLRPNNGGEMPDDSGGVRPGGLPDFPPEWGSIVIPDDASELDHEAAALRRELRRQSRQTRLRAAFGLAAPGREGAPLGVPVIIMAVAVITTLLSLFVVTWDRGPTSSPITNAAPTPTALMDVVLADAGGDRVRIGDVAPAVILLTEGCNCSALVAAIAGAAPAAVTVLPVAKDAPCAVGTAPNLRCLADPGGVVTGRYPPPTTPAPAAPSAAGAPSPATGTPAAAPSVRAVLVDSNGNGADPVTVTSPADLSAGFGKLIGG